MNFEQFIRPELLILIPVLYLIGVGIKKSNLQDELIPIILGGIGVIVAGIYLAATQPIETTQDIASCVFMAITQGVLCAGASVYANQIFKQIVKLGEEQKENKEKEQ